MIGPVRETINVACDENKLDINDVMGKETKIILFVVQVSRDFFFFLIQMDVLFKIRNVVTFDMIFLTVYEQQQ